MGITIAIRTHSNSRLSCNIFAWTFLLTRPSKQAIDDSRTGSGPSLYNSSFKPVIKGIMGSLDNRLQRPNDRMALKRGRQMVSIQHLLVSIAVGSCNNVNSMNK